MRKKASVKGVPAKGGLVLTPNKKGEKLCEALSHDLPKEKGFRV